MEKDKIETTASKMTLNLHTLSGQSRRKLFKQLLSLLALPLILLVADNSRLACGQLNEKTHLADDIDGDAPTSYFEEGSLASRFDQRASFDHYITYSMEALTSISGFDNDLHRYDSKQDLIRSFARNLSYTDDLSSLRARIDSSELSLLSDQSELTLMENERNQVECGQQLDALISESRKLFQNFDSFSNSKQLNLIELLDSFGAPSTQLMQGNFLWLGSHEQCAKAKLSTRQADGQLKQSEARYCIANFRSPNWPNRTDGSSDRLGGHSIKLGVCLPRTCNSISILRHGNRIESIAKLVRLNQIPFSSYKLTHLFCLPDEGSPLRQFSFQAKLFIVILSGWLTIVAHFSIKYEYLRMMWPEDKKRHENESKCMRIFAIRLSWSKLFQSIQTHHSSVPLQTPKATSTAQIPLDLNEKLDCSNASDSRQPRSGEREETLAAQLAYSHKASNLLEALKTATPQDSSNLNKITSIVNAVPLDCPEKRKTAAILVVNSGLSSEHSAVKPTVDLSVVDGVKVLSMIWLISAHTLLFFIRTIANGRDFWSLLRDARFMSIMAGIFPVDTFFTITGILTAYLKFNKHENKLTTGSYWLETFVHRYLRFMPMYLIVFWYTRDVSEYIGLGPLWDYATADTSLRSVCKQESFTVPLFFQANFKPIDKHCVKPAWYLANDYQYLLITPIFMWLILKSKVLGYTVIGFSVAASLVLQFLTVFYSTDVDDFGALINFKPMFGAYVLKNLWKLYVLPYNRIPPYLIGILTGHLMFTLNKRVSSHQAAARESSNQQLPEKQTKENSLSQSASDGQISKSSSSSSFQSQDSLGSSSQHHHESTSNILDGFKPSTVRSVNKLDALKSYLCVKIWIPLVLLISIIYLPLLTKLSTQEGSIAKIGTSSIIALMRLVWSISIARLIYICSTRSLHAFNQKSSTNQSDSFVIRLLSSPKWKPWSKIGLSALLIQWEVISYLAQTQTSAANMTITFLLATILVCIFATYSLALLIYLTMEYPLSQIEQLYIHPRLFKSTR